MRWRDFARFFSLHDGPSLTAGWSPEFRRQKGEVLGKSDRPSGRELLLLGWSRSICRFLDGVLGALFGERKRLLDEVLGALFGER